jgi:hypothetical protein
MNISIIKAMISEKTIKTIEKRNKEPCRQAKKLTL